MILKLEILGVGILGLLAVGGVGASTAQAQAFTSTTGYPVTITGSSGGGNEVISTEGGTAECDGHFSGSLSEASSSVTIAVTYTDCTGVFGFATGTVNMNGCDYVFHIYGEVDLECPGTSKVQITAGTCEVQIPTHTGLTKNTMWNNGSHIDMEFNLTGIVYIVTKDGFLCPFGGTGIKTGGTYTQNLYLTYKAGGGSVHIG